MEQCDHSNRLDIDAIYSLDPNELSTLDIDINQKEEGNGKDEHK